MSRTRFVITYLFSLLLLESGDIYISADQVINTEFYLVRYIDIEDRGSMKKFLILSVGCNDVKTYNEDKIKKYLHSMNTVSLYRRIKRKSFFIKFIKWQKRSCQYLICFEEL